VVPFGAAAAMVPLRSHSPNATVALILALVVSLLAAAGTADAVTCYMLFDRFDNVVYRNTVSPIDLNRTIRTRRTDDQSQRAGASGCGSPPSRWSA